MRLIITAPSLPTTALPVHRRALYGTADSEHAIDGVQRVVASTYDSTVLFPVPETPHRRRNVDGRCVCSLHRARRGSESSASTSASPPRSMQRCSARKLRVRGDWAYSSHIRAETARAATSAPGLGLPSPLQHRRGSSAEQDAVLAARVAEVINSAYLSVRSPADVKKRCRCNRQRATSNVAPRNCANDTTRNGQHALCSRKRATETRQHAAMKPTTIARATLSVRVRVSAGVRAGACAYACVLVCVRACM